MSALHAGTIIDKRYQICKTLGSGGSGTVYLTQDLQTQHQIALKILDPTSHHENLQRQFKREFFLLSQIKHPNIVQTYHWGRHNNQSYFTMDYVPGKTLADIIATPNTQNQMRDTWIYALLSQLLNGLAHIHDQNIIHADLKPSNIIISETENDIHTTILDFGLTQLKHQNAPSSNPFSSPIGTAEYMSPEQVKGLQVDHRSDLYALGVMLYETLTGHPPFTGKKPIEILLKHIQEKPQFAQPATHPTLQKIALTLLEKDPINRYQSATDLHNVIHPLKNKIKPRTIRPLQPQFSGRKTEIDTLKGLLKQKPIQHAQLVFISGEAGIGKSRLLEEFQSEARIQGFNVLTGQCTQESSTPFVAISDVFKKGETQNESGKPLRLDAVLKTLQNKSRAKRTVLCLEDIQWIDEWTQRLLRLLTYEDLPITLCLTSRQTQPQYPQWLAYLAKSIKSTHHHLSALSKTETNRLMASIVGEQKLPTIISKAVYQETGGHPLYIAQLTRTALSTKALTFTPTGKWHYHPLSQNEVPPSLTTTFQQRIRAIPKQQRLILEFASILQDAFSFEQICAIYPNTEETLHNDLHDLCVQDILRQKSGTYYFSHALLQKAIYQQLSTTQQQQLHQQAGLYFETQDAEKHVESLAYHFSKSKDKKRAYPYLIAAGKHARNTEDYRQAENHFEEAFTYFITKKYASKKTEDIQRDAEFLCDYTYVLWARNKHPKALEIIAMAFPLIPNHLPLVKANAMRMRGYVYQTLGQAKHAERDLLQALDIYIQHNHTNGAFNAQAHLSAIYGYLGQFKDSETYAHQAVKSYHQLRETTDDTTGQIYLGRTAFFASQFQKAQHLLELAASGTSPNDNVSSRAKCFEMLNRISFFNGEFDQAEKQLNEFIIIQRKQGATSPEAMGLTWLGELALEQGHIEKASAHAQEALHLMSQIGERPNLIRLYALQAAILAESGHLSDALDWAQKTAQKTAQKIPHLDITASHHLPSIWCNLALVYEKAGHIEEAESAFENAIECRQKLHGGEWGISFIKAAEFYMRQGNNPVALTHLKTAIKVCEEMDMDYFAKKAQQMQKNITEQSRLNILYKTCEDLISILDLNQLLDATLSRILTQSKASRAIVALKNEHGQTDIVRTHNVPGTAVEEISSSIIHQAIETNEIIISLNAYNDERFFNQQSVIDFNIQAVLCLPLFHVKAGVIGALYVDHQGLESFFTDADEAFLKALGQLISIAIINAQTHTQLQEKATHLQEQLETRNTFGELIGTSQPMQDIYTVLKQASQTDITVLLQGETGTGKELAARAIHFNSNRKKERFFAQNCSAIASELLQSELFGHQKGAFTGATTNRAGIFESADGGTVFLDEIGDASPQVQASLLRVLENGEIRRVGDTTHQKVNVRIIAATNRNLAEEVAQGNFRQDLYYRLQVLQIEMPPLRQRTKDIPLLTNHFLQQIAPQQNKTINGFTQDAIHHLLIHNWPGNVRELENEIQRAVALTNDNQAISSDVFTNKIQYQMPANNPSDQTLKDQVETLEKQRITQILQQTQGNITQAASILGLTRHGLYKKMARYNLQK